MDAWAPEAASGLVDLLRAAHEQSLLRRLCPTLLRAARLAIQQSDWRLIRLAGRTRRRARKGRSERTDRAHIDFDQARPLCGDGFSQSHRECVG